LDLQMTDKPPDRGVVVDTGSTYSGFPIEVRQTRDRGRIMVTTKDLKAGDIILRSMAYMTAVGDEYKTTVCSSCFKPCLSRLSVCCESCREVYFCDQRCRNNAGHFDTECQALRKLHSRENHFTNDENSEIRMILSLLAKAAEEKKNNGQPQHEKVLRQLDPSDPGLQSIKQPLYEDYLKLVPNSQNYKPETQLSVKRMARYVSKIFPKPEVNYFDDEEIYALFFREKCNCFGIWDYKDRCLGSAVYPTASFLNHSCAPNCTRFPDQNGLISVRTLYPLPAGTELCISYITLHDSSTESRMEQLRYYYCFECGCARCADPTGAIDSFMEAYLCKRDGCTGLLVPVDVGKERAVRRCRVCPYEEVCPYDEMFGACFFAPHLPRAATQAVN